MPATRQRTARVLLCSYGFQVCRINTRAVLAHVVDDQAERNGAKGQLVRDSMSLTHLAVTPYLAIVADLACSPPFKATSGRNHDEPRDSFGDTSLVRRRMTVLAHKFDWTSVLIGHLDPRLSGHWQTAGFPEIRK